MTAHCPWDEGLKWRSIRTVEPDELPMSVSYVTAQVLRVANGTAEDTFVESLIKAATDACEKDTGRALMPQTWQMKLSRFPYGRRPIVIARLPIIAVDAVTYTDPDGQTVELTGSPADFLTLPDGEFVRGQIVPLVETDWPATKCVDDAVTVTFRCGYEDADAVPNVLKVGMGLMIAELYKQRTLSVQSVHNTPSVLSLPRFWRKVEG